MEPSIDPEIEEGNIGMEKIDIEALPATVYRTGSPLTDMDCPICLADFAGMECLFAFQNLWKEKSCEYYQDAVTVSTWIA